MFPKCRQSLPDYDMDRSGESQMSLYQALLEIGQYIGDLVAIDILKASPLKTILHSMAFPEQEIAEKGNSGL